MGGGDHGMESGVVERWSGSGWVVERVRMNRNSECEAVEHTLHATESSSAAGADGLYYRDLLVQSSRTDTRAAISTIMRPLSIAD
jgi:hypothetical protein